MNISGKPSVLAVHIPPAPPPDAGGPGLDLGAVQTNSLDIGAVED